MKFDLQIVASIFLIVVLVSCKRQVSDRVTSTNSSNFPDLAGSEWQFMIDDNCINYYTFGEDSTSQYYSCESDDIYYGKYYIKNDTLFVHNFVTNSDSTLGADEKEHHSQEALYKIIFESGKLKHVARLTFSISTQTWVNDDFVFDEDFLFEKVAK